MANLEREITDKLTVEAWATGRKEARGELSVVVHDYEVGRVAADLTPEEARQMATVLTYFAAQAEKFSTRGFVGSDE